MIANFKNQKGILDKLGIEKLNSMQKEAQGAIHTKKDIVLLSPTGTGKTLAFLLPVLQGLVMGFREVQVLILVPSRELAIQIEQVVREMGTGFKANAVYGGRSGYQDKMDLKHRPAILIGTPGRVADHLRRDRFPTHNIKTLVLDEFDKSLEIGFESEMMEIVKLLKGVEKRILTSATSAIEIPEFVGLRNPTIVDYSQEKIAQLKLKKVISPSKDKLDTLVDTLNHIGNQPAIVFCNYKESIQRVSDHLNKNNIKHGCFFGGMEQIDRERALLMFRNGTHQIIIATDLAARGIDVPEIKFIIHYHLPLRIQEFTHRNGRTARMHSDGTAYVLQWSKEELPGFIPELEIEDLTSSNKVNEFNWRTLYVSGGRRDKISKGDIAGFFLKQAKLKKDQLGTIELKQDCAYVAVEASLVDHIIKMTNNTKLKKKKVRVSLL